MSQSYSVAPTVVRVVDGGLVASFGKREWKLAPLAFHLDTHRKDVRYRKVEDGGHLILVGRPLQRVYRFDDAVVAFMKSAKVEKPAMVKRVATTVLPPSNPLHASAWREAALTGKLVKVQKAVALILPTPAKPVATEKPKRVRKSRKVAVAVV